MPQRILPDQVLTYTPIKGIEEVAPAEQSLHCVSLFIAHLPRAPLKHAVEILSLLMVPSLLQSILVLLQQGFEVLRLSQVGVVLREIQAIVSGLVVIASCQQEAPLLRQLSYFRRQEFVLLLVFVFYECLGDLGVGSALLRDVAVWAVAPSVARSFLAILGAARVPSITILRLS